MYKGWVGGGVVLFLVMGAARAEMHAFELKDGRTLEAEVMGYNAKLGKVELKRQDGKCVKVKPGVFVEADQAYINDWSSLDSFRNKSSFKVDLNKNTVEKWKEDGEVHEVRHERLEYEVSFENRATIPIKNLNVEYCIFYEQERSRPGHKKTTTKLYKAGKLDLDKLLAKEKRTLVTESIVLSRYDFNSTEFYYDNGDPESASGKIKGIWMRLTVGINGGEIAVRNIFKPASLEGRYTWKEGSTATKEKKRKKKS